MILPTVRERPSPNHQRRSEPARIDMLVLHYTGMKTAGEAIDRLCDPAARVSAHYVVEEDGTVWRLVPEAFRAFHAGRSCWAGGSDLNDVSIAVEHLSAAIVSRFAIPPYRVVGHSDIAPDRKSDPGELFDWARLARAGIGIWPEPAAGLAHRRGRGIGVAERAAALADLTVIGYCVTAAAETAAVAAFQRRFRPARWDGRLDAETAQRLAEVRAAYDRV